MAPPWDWGPDLLHATVLSEAPPLVLLINFLFHDIILAHCGSPLAARQRKRRTHETSFRQNPADSPLHSQIVSQQYPYAVALWYNFAALDKCVSTTFTMNWFVPDIGAIIPHRIMSLRLTYHVWPRLTIDYRMITVGGSPARFSAILPFPPRSQSERHDPQTLVSESSVIQ